MSNLQVTYGQFVAKGIVTGLSNEKAFSEGKKDGGNPWQKVQFGIKTGKTESVYVELMGSKMKEVQFVYRDPSSKKRDNSNTKNVAWKDIYKERNDNFEIQMNIKAGLERDDEGKKVKENKTLTPYDAVDYIKKYLKDGESVFVRGSLQITEYNGKAQEKYTIQQIYVTNEKVDFDAEDFVKEASFNQEIVYIGYEDDDEKGKVYIDTYIIYKKDKVISHVPYSFVIDYKKYESDKDKHEKILKLIKSFKGLPFGSTIKVNGNINNGVVTTNEKVEDDFGGFDAEGQGEYITDRIRELEITGGSGETLIKERYTEEDFYRPENPFDGNASFEDESSDELPF